MGNDQSQPSLLVAHQGDRRSSEPGSLSLPLATVADKPWATLNKQPDYLSAADVSRRPARGRSWNGRSKNRRWDKSAEKREAELLPVSCTSSTSPKPVRPPRPKRSLRTTSLISSEEALSSYEGKRSAPALVEGIKGKTAAITDGGSQGGGDEHFTEGAPLSNTAHSEHLYTSSDSKGKNHCALHWHSSVDHSASSVQESLRSKSTSGDVESIFQFFGVTQDYIERAFSVDVSFDFGGSEQAFVHSHSSHVVAPVTHNPSNGPVSSSEINVDIVPPPDHIITSCSSNKCHQPHLSLFVDQLLAGSHIGKATHYCPRLEDVVGESLSDDEQELSTRPRIFSTPKMETSSSERALLVSHASAADSGLHSAAKCQTSADGSVDVITLSENGELEDGKVMTETSQDVQAIVMEEDDTRPADLEQKSHDSGLESDRSGDRSPDMSSPPAGPNADLLNVAKRFEAEIKEHFGSRLDAVEMQHHHPWHTVLVDIGNVESAENLAASEKDSALSNLLDYSPGEVHSACDKISSSDIAGKELFDQGKDNPLSLSSVTLLNNTNSKDALKFTVDANGPNKPDQALSDEEIRTKFAILIKEVEDENNVLTSSYKNSLASWCTEGLPASLYASKAAACSDMLPEEQDEVRADDKESPKSTGDAVDQASSDEAILISLDDRADEERQPCMGLGSQSMPYEKSRLCKPEAEPEAEAEAKPETEAEAKPETEAEDKPEAEPETEPMPGNGSECQETGWCDIGSQAGSPEKTNPEDDDLDRHVNQDYAGIADGSFSTAGEGQYEQAVEASSQRENDGQERHIEVAVSQLMPGEQNKDQTTPCLSDAFGDQDACRLQQTSVVPGTSAESVLTEQVHTNASECFGIKQNSQLDEEQPKVNEDAEIAHENGEIEKVNINQEVELECEDKDVGQDNVYKEVKVEREGEIGELNIHQDAKITCKDDRLDQGNVRTLTEAQPKDDEAANEEHVNVYKEAEAVESNCEIATKDAARPKFLTETLVEARDEINQCETIVKVEELATSLIEKDLSGEGGIAGLLLGNSIVVSPLSIVNTDESESHRETLLPDANKAAAVVMPYLTKSSVGFPLRIRRAVVVETGGTTFKENEAQVDEQNPDQPKPWQESLESTTAPFLASPLFNFTPRSNWLYKRSLSLSADSEARAPVRSSAEHSPTANASGSVVAALAATDKKPGSDGSCSPSAATASALSFAMPSKLRLGAQPFNRSVSSHAFKPLGKLFGPSAAAATTTLPGSLDERSEDRSAASSDIVSSKDAITVDADKNLYESRDATSVPVDNAMMSKGRFADHEPLAVAPDPKSCFLALSNEHDFTTQQRSLLAKLDRGSKEDKVTDEVSTVRASFRPATAATVASGLVTARLVAISRATDGTTVPQGANPAALSAERIRQEVHRGRARTTLSAGSFGSDETDELLPSSGSLSPGTDQAADDTSAAGLRLQGIEKERLDVINSMKVRRKAVDLQQAADTPADHRKTSATIPNRIRRLSLDGSSRSAAAIPVRSQPASVTLKKPVLDMVKTLQSSDGTD